MDTKRVERLPRRELWSVRVRITDPSTGADLTGYDLLPCSLGEWLKGEGEMMESKPERWYLDYCEEQLREKWPSVREYIIRLVPELRAYEYVTDDGRLRLVPANTLRG